MGDAQPWQMRIGCVLVLGVGVSACGGNIPPVGLGAADDRLFVTFAEQFDGEATINDRVVELARFPASCNLWDSCGNGSAQATLFGADGFDPTVPIVLRASSGSAEATYVFPAPADAVLEGGALVAASINTLRVDGGFRLDCRDRGCGVTLELPDRDLRIAMTQVDDVELAVALPEMPPGSVAEARVGVVIDGVRGCEPCDGIANATMGRSLSTRTTF